MTNENNKPFQTIRDGSLKATIWRNESEKGPFYSVNFIRTYKIDGGDYKENDSFSGSELLQLGHLATKAYDVISEARAADRKHTAQ